MRKKILYADNNNIKQYVEKTTDNIISMSCHSEGVMSKNYTLWIDEAKNLHSALGEILNIPDEISRLKALLISEKRSNLCWLHDAQPDSVVVINKLELFKKQNNLQPAKTIKHELRNIQHG